MLRRNALTGLAIVAISSLTWTPAWAKVPPGNDPGNNNLPPANAILDLAGTPIPGGGNSMYQKYTTSFVASANSTAITFAFREDPAFIYFSSPSVTDQTISSGNLLTNADFSGGAHLSSGNSQTPIGWTYANVYGATFGGVLDANCGVGPGGSWGVGYCWYDGAVQAYDALTQTIATTAGHRYQITFWIADNSGCATFNGPILPCNFSELSTNGDSIDTGGNGIDVLVYTGAALPAPAALHVELATAGAPPNQGMQALATALTTSGAADNLQDAAQKVGFDHFNWLQIILADRQLQACAANESLPGCSSDFTSSGAVPLLPTADPPPGGYAYELCPPGLGFPCQTTFPVQDYWAMYWDEYFAPVPGTPYYAPNPGSPEYLLEYRQGNRLATMGATGVGPAQALGMSFSDDASSDFAVPGSPGTAESISFVTALVGVTGSCNALISSNCQFLIIPGTIFKWTSTGGGVGFTSTPGGPLSQVAPAASTPAVRVVKQPDNFPTGLADLTGAQLSASLISVDEFYQLTNLTPQSLAAMGGGISIFSAQLIPAQAAALAAVNEGGTLVPASEATVTASGLTYSRLTRTFKGTITVENISSSAIPGPMQVLLNGLPSSVSLANATGNLAGTPYLTVAPSGLAA